MMEGFDRYQIQYSFISRKDLIILEKEDSIILFWRKMTRIIL